MFKLNLKIALRNLFKNKVYSIINIGGLAIGLASCLLLILYATYEWGFDKQYKKSQDLYQAMINLKDKNGNISRTIDLTQNVMLASLKNDFPDVKGGSRITNLYKRVVATKQNSLKLDNRYVDSEFLDLFDFRFISGNPKNALEQPNSIILTESSARKIFGRTDVLNQYVKFEDQADLIVTAVIEDLPANVTYGFETLTNFKLYENLNEWPKKPNWGSHDYYTLLWLNETADINTINLKLKGYVAKHHLNANEDVFLYPLTKLHLYGEFVNGKSNGGNIQKVRLFVGLAMGILLIACINFMNLATANTQSRTKEIGVKKTMGASKGDLILQFMLESFIITLISILLSIIILEFAIPKFNQLLDIQIEFDYFSSVNWILISCVFLTTGLISGSYPSFYLSSFNAVKALKKTLNFKNGYSLTFRQILVIVQFCFSIILIASTITIYKQIQFINNKPIGYQVNGLIEIPHEGMLYPKFNLLKSKLLSSNAVVSLAQSSGSLSSKNSTTRGLVWDGMNERDSQIDFDQIFTTYDFLKTANIKLLQGRDFNEKYASDSAAVLISKTALKTMHLNHPIGNYIVFQGVKRNIVGVFDDIIWDNPSKKVPPMIIAFANVSDVITMRLNPQKSLSNSIKIINDVVKEINTNFPVEIQFIDTLNLIKLKNERILSTLANIFGGLAIFISCLGLFGLTSFSTKQRIKEVGIRKILGASIREIMILLSTSFIRLILLAISIALPIAYFIMDKWLQNFELRTSLNFSIFLATAIVILLITLITISWQTYRAAKINAIDTLKYE